MPLARERIGRPTHRVTVFRWGLADWSQSSEEVLRGRAYGIEVRMPDVGEDAYRAYLPSRYAR